MYRAVLKPDAQAKEELSRSFACASGINPAMHNLATLRVPVTMVAVFRKKPGQLLRLG
jgi:hypothetical protein